MDGITVPGGGAPIDPSLFAPPPDHSKRAEKANAPGSDTSQTQSTDPSQTDTSSTVNTYKEQADQQDGGQGGGTGGGGTSGGGSSDSGGSFSGGAGGGDSNKETDAALITAFGDANVIDGILLNSAAGTQRVIKTSDSMMRAILPAQALYSVPLATGNPNNPLLARPALFDPSGVLQELKGNPWFSSTFLVTITMNMSTLIAIQSKIQEAEMKLTVLMMEQTVTQAHLTGDLILAAAEKEAQMYMAMAIASIVSLAVGIVGAGLSGLGKFKSAMKSLKMKDMKNAKELENKPQNVEAKLGSEGGTNVAGSKQKQKIDKAKKEEAADETSAQKSDDDKLQVRIEKGPDGKKRMVAGGDGSKAEWNEGPNKSAEGKGMEIDWNTIKQTKVKAQTKAKNEEITRDSEAKPKDGKDAKEVKYDYNEMRKNAKLKAKWDSVGDLGTFLVQTNTSLNNILTNFIQMVFKPEIGALERGKTLSEARQKIIASSLDYATQAFNTAGQIIDSAIQELQKIQDETSRANDWKG